MNKPEMQKYELELIDLIVTDGIRDRLQSMSEHPRYQELKDLQAELYPEEE